MLTEGSIEIVPNNCVVSNMAEILHLDLTKCKVEDFASFSSDFELKVTKSGNITAIGGCFDTLFAQMKNSVNLSTSPLAPPTHWKQTVFYMEEDLDVREGDVIYGSVACR